MGVERLSWKESVALIRAGAEGQVVRSLTLEGDAARIEFENGAVLTVVTDDSLSVSLSEPKGARAKAKRKDGR